MGTVKDVEVEFLPYQKRCIRKLRAVAADKNMANKINYNSDIGRQIEAAVSVKEKEINAKSKSDVMQEIFNGWHRLNYNEKIWSEKEDHPKFVIEDFQDRKHTSLDSYMKALAKDEMIKDKIDKFSDVGREINNIREFEAEKELPVHKRSSLSVMREIEEKSNILKMNDSINDHSKNYVDEGRENARKFMVEDFDGRKHDSYNKYLVAVSRDYFAKDKIDNNTELGQELERKLIIETERNLPLSERSSLSIMNEIAEKRAALNSRNFAADYVKGKNLIVEDFRGEEHTTEQGYLHALAHDSAIQDRIDKTSDLGMELEMQRQPARETGRVLERTR